MSIRSNLWLTPFIFGLAIFITIASPTFSAAGESIEDKPGWMEWGDAYCAAKPVSGGEFRLSWPLYIGLMNPHHMPVLDWQTMAYMYEKLILLDASYRPTIPWLAESWKFLDETTVLMKLRQGVRFHDGSAFNAQSLKRQMEYIMDKDNAAWTRTWIEPLESVEVIDEYTVKWHFKRPWGAFLGTMASVPGFMVSGKALEGDAALAKIKKFEREMISARRNAGDKNDPEKAAAGKKWLAELEKEVSKYSPLAKDAKSLDNYPVGTGPYMLESSSTDNYVLLKRNPDWWFGQTIARAEMPYFEGIKVSVIPDPSVRLANLKAGMLDSVYLDPIQYRVMKNDPNFKLESFPTNWLIFLTFNHAKGPCADIRVRKAISHAIDREALVMGTQFGLGRIANCIYPDDHWAHNPELKPVTYDPELSRKLLSEAGYPNGLTIKGFTLNIPEAEAFAKAVMAMLEKVGIIWRPQFMSIAGMIEPFRKLDYDVIGNLYPFIQEPDHIATMLYDPESPFNNGRSRNEKAVELIRKGRETEDEKERARIYFEMEKVLYDNYEDAWLWYPTVVLAANKRVEGFNLDMFLKYGEGYYFTHPLWFKEGRP
ncbi:MAG: ABC transporter substrate-binding protein [Desulfobacterales bacterium]|jgi:peptide/nickel transport system substrate-binding protein|nr:ABC transporter substrate-binding protein [Desulfobacterales bacterium]